MTGDVLALLLVNGCLLAAGAGVTRALGAWREPRELLTVLATSFLAGAAVFGVLAQLLYVVGFSLSISQTLAVCGLLAASGLLRVLPGSPLANQPLLSRRECLAAAIVAIPLILLAVAAVYQPLSSWDAWTQWTPKARALVELDGLDSSYFASPPYGHWHPDYPLLVPSLEAFAFRFGVGVRVAQLEFWFLLAAFAVAVVELLRPRVGPLLTWAAALALVWTPKLGAEAMSANADMPLAIFLVLAAVAAWLWISEGSTPALGLVAVFGAAAVATKLEGVIELAIVLAVAVWVALSQSRRSALLLAGAGAVALTGFIPWRLWTMLTDAPTAYSASSVVDTVEALEPDRVPIASLLLLRQLFDPEVWLLLVPLALCALAVAALAVRRDRLVPLSTAVFLAVALVTALLIPPYSYGWQDQYWLLFLPAVLAGGALVVAMPGRSRAAGFVTTSVAGLFAALVAIYLFTPYDFAWHLGTSTSRVVTPLALLSAAFAPIVLARASRQGPAGRVP